MKVLVTGSAAVGKSTVAEELQRRGYSAWDADEHAAWLDDNGRPLDWQECRIQDPEWIAAHRWNWDPDWIEGVLMSERDDYVCGSASNLREHIGRFDVIYLLLLDEAVEDERLETRTTNDFGREPAIRELVRSWQADFRAWLAEQGAIEIDASRPLDDVVGEILAAPG